MIAVKIDFDGKNYELDQEKLDNWLVIEALAEINEGNILSLVKLKSLFLGEALYEHIKRKNALEDGRISVAGVTSDIMSIFTLLRDAGKK